VAKWLDGSRCHLIRRPHSHSCILVGFGHIVLHGDPAHPPRGTASPNFRSMSIVAKRSPISATIVSPAKTAEPIEIPFGLWTLVDTRKHVLHGVHIGATWRRQLNRPCAAAMQPFCQSTLTTCYYNNNQRQCLWCCPYCHGHLSLDSFSFYQAIRLLNRRLSINICICICICTDRFIVCHVCRF